MTTIAVHVHIAADGKLDVSADVPPEWRGQTVDGVLVLGEGAMDAVGKPVATPSALIQRQQALAALADDADWRALIPDPVAWQQDQRRDRPLPGRD